MKNFQSLPRKLNKSAFILWAGDLAMFLLFTVAGGREHQMGLSSFGALKIAAPFLLAWTAVGLLAGAFRPTAYANARNAAAALAAAWIFALPAGLLLRLAMYGKPVFTVFAALAFIFIYAFLLAWRLLFVALRKWLARQPSNR